jgi:hypothetical protein
LRTEAQAAASARQHSVSDHAIVHAFNNPVRVEDLDEGLVMLVGPDHAGNLLEIGVLTSDEGPVIVHAMPARQVPKVMLMPRTVAEILNQADELAARFEADDPDAVDVKDAAALRAVRQAFQAEPEAEPRLADAVSVALPKGTRGPRSVPWSAHQAKPHASVMVAQFPSGERRPGTEHR